MKNDLVDVCRRSTAVLDSRIAVLGKEIQKQINERNMIETKLEEASREPGVFLLDAFMCLVILAASWSVLKA